MVLTTVALVCISVKYFATIAYWRKNKTIQYFVYLKFRSSLMLAIVGGYFRKL